MVGAARSEASEIEQSPRQDKRYSKKLHDNYTMQKERLGKKVESMGEIKASKREEIIRTSKMEYK